MSENSKIEWTDHTFNPWVGCTKISPACDHCYAEGWSKRSGMVEWGGERKRTSPQNWREPLKWDKRASQRGARERVFCASLADVFDNQVTEAWRQDLWELIWSCRHLDWLLLTKRPQNIAKMLPRKTDWNMDDWPWRHVWLGTTVENQEEADRRVPHLLAVPAAVRFLSCEPLLGPLDLYNGDPDPRLGGHRASQTFLGDWWEPGDNPRAPPRHGVDWVIAGGESGPGARPMHLEWARSLRDQCTVTDVPFLFKQWGEHVPGELLRDGREEPWRRYQNGQELWTVAELGGADLDRVDYMRVGKKEAGRLLDGRTHDDLPEPAAALAAL